MYWSHRTTTTPVKVTLIEEKPAQPTTNTQSTTAVAPDVTVTEAVSENHLFEQAIEQIQQSQKDQIQALAGQITAIQTNQTVLLSGQNAARAQVALLGEAVAELKRQLAETQHANELTRSELTTLIKARVWAASAPELAPEHLPNPSDFNPGAPGVTVTDRNNTWLISFNPGLFDRDEHFKIGAKSRLESVAKALVQSQAKYNIRIIGIAENEAPTWPWSSAQTREELGLLRAQRVLLYLRGLEIFPSDKLSTVSGESIQRPFSTPNMNGCVAQFVGKRT